MREYLNKLIGKLSLMDLFIFTTIIASTTAFLPFVCDIVKSVAELLNENFNNSRSTKFAIAAAAILAIFSIVNKLKNKKISKAMIIASTYLALFYLYFRWHNRCIAWEYIKYGYVTYFDIVGVLSAIIIILYLREHLSRFPIKNETNTESDILLSDDAITHSHEDILNRIPFVKNFAKGLSCCNTSASAYSIGVVAPWGNGKTSFIRLFAEEVQKDKKFEMIHFSPWHYSSRTDIVSAFYKQLSEHLAINDIELFRLICNYSGWLIGEEKKSLLLPFSHSGEQPEELYSKISKILSKRPKRIIFIIDDLDRLEGKEILEVLKIIRGSANFPNIIFIAAYDKEYVMKAIKAVHSGGDERFIEKFFQTEYHLPQYPTDKIEKFVLSKAKEFMTHNDFSLFKEKYIEYNGLLSVTKPCDDCIKNIRDAKRWINTIKIGYQRLKNEVNICDYADVAILKLYFPTIYNIFSNDYKTYLYEDNKCYNFWKEGAGKNNHYFGLINANKKNFWECDEVVCLSKRSREKLKNILNRLIPETNLALEEKSFANPFYTPRYFYDTLQSHDIPDAMFAKFIKMSHEDLKKALSDEFIEHRAIAFINHWRSYKPNNDEERLKLLRMIFYVCYKSDNITCSQNVIYDIVKGFEKEKNKVAGILRETMLENGASYYVCRLIHDINKGFYNWENLISREELENILLENFKYAIEEDMPTYIVLNFFWTTSKEVYCSENNKKKITYNPKAIAIFKKGITENPCKYLFNLIETEPSPMAEIKEWEPHRVIPEAWPDWNDFELFINSIPESDKCNEYRRFFAAFKENGYRAVPFRFKYCIKHDE